MKVSYKWLKDYIDIDVDPDKLCEILTDSGLEVEGLVEFESVKGGLQGIIVGEVLETAPHPNADKLTLAKVDTGKGIIKDIVCGAPNVTAGQKVAVASIGTKLYFGDQQITIKKSKIRGEVSEGMICAEDELGLGNSHDGIMVLDPSVEAGKPLSDYFKVGRDYVIEIGLTPNRSDAASHIGVVRDIFAVFSHLRSGKGPAIQWPDVSAFKKDNDDLPFEVKVEDHKACPRYSGLTLTGVEVKESPAWLKNKLRAVGVRPINNLVDIGQFVMLETGQPLHIFDAEEMHSNAVIIKKLKDKTAFTTLDEIKRELSADDLMICDENGGMCIAGVFGGLHSGVSGSTTSIFIESACFDPVHVRKTSRRHGLKTDASFRFERGTDPEMTVFALKRAALLIKELAGGNISSDIIDVYPVPVLAREIEIRTKNITRLIGKEIPHEEIVNILESLDISIKPASDDSIIVKVPPYRVDVLREADVAEEILRIYGYNNIENPTRLNTSLSYSPKPDRKKLQNKISDFLSSNGFYEIWCNSLVNSDYSEKVDGFEPANNVVLLNPISSDLDVMRQGMIFGGLETIAHNQNRQHPDLKLYEFGRTYAYDMDKGSRNDHASYTENEKLALLITGRKYSESWNTPDDKIGFYDLKSAVNQVLQVAGGRLKDISVSEEVPPYLSYGISYIMGGALVVVLGKVDKKVLDVFGIKEEVYYADIDWEKLVSIYDDYKLGFHELPKYFSVRRDLALLLDKDVTFDRVSGIATKIAGPLLKEVNLFDVYEGDKIGQEKKSYAVSYILQDENKTLTDKVIDKIMNKLIRAYEEQLGARLR